MKTFKQYLDTIGEYGVVSEVRYPLVTVTGLPTVRPAEVIMFESGEKGEVFSVNETTADVILYTKHSVTIGTKAVRTNEILKIPVGEGLLGCVINPLGEMIGECSGAKKTSELREIHPPSAGISKRARITRQLSTGVGIIDILLPLGKGQKELIIGDRKTGKTSFVLSTVIHQAAHEDAIIVYALVGKRKSDIKKLHSDFTEKKVTPHSVIVASSSDDPPGLILFTPYSAMTVAEYFRDQGKDVLVVLDDLSTHARFYREVSLQAHRFPGRESYPGDIFYTHAKLIERGGSFIHPKGSVSITCLPVVESVEGDFTGYIQSNLMGMTDGHIYFDSEMYNQGRRPAVNLPLSVTRVGKQTQSPLLREINVQVSAFLANYEKMQSFSHFGAELSPKVKSVLSMGKALYLYFNQQIGEVVAQEVQLVLFGLLWLQMLGEEVDENSIQTMREKLTRMYEDKNNSALFSLLQSAENLTEFLENIKKNADKFV